MPPVPVEVSVIYNGGLFPVGIEGVLVNFYQNEFTYITGATTDADGRASTLLEPGVYEIRFFKPGVFFTESRKRIEVLDPPPPNTQNWWDVFAVDGTAVSFTGLTNMCRVRAMLMDIAGRYLRNVTFRFTPILESPLQTPKLWEDIMLSADAIEVRTDDNGAIELDLPTGGKFYVTWAGESDELYCFTVPEGCTAYLWDYVFPYPGYFEYPDLIGQPGDDNNISVAVGERLEVPFTVNFSDATEGPKDQSIDKWFTFVNQDETIFKLEADYVARKLFVTGLAPGVATADIEYKQDVVPVRRPFPFFQQNTILTVTVT